MKKYIIIGGSVSDFVKDGKTLKIRRLVVAEKSNSSIDFGNIKAKEFKVTEEAFSLSRQLLMREVNLIFDEYGRVCNVCKVS